MAGPTTGGLPLHVDIWSRPGETWPVCLSPISAEVKKPSVSVDSVEARRGVSL
jgi:hypothetical protein